MRLLVMDQFGELGGAQRGLLEAAEGFAARGWDVHALVPEGPLPDALASLCRSVHTIPCGPFQAVHKGPADAIRLALQMREQVRAIRRAVGEHDIQVVYVNGPRLLPAVALAQSNRKVIFHSHSVVTQEAAVRTAQWALRRSRAKVLASSKFVAHWLYPLLNPESVSVIYNGVAGCGVPPPRPKSCIRRIGVLGRIAPEKGQITFIRAARMASRQRPDLHFVIGGAPMFASDAYFNQVRREAGDNVMFAGWADPASSFFEQIDLLVVPSTKIDANPRVVPEAFSAGVPVLAFAAGGIPELLEENVTGTLVHEHTPHALAAGILRAIEQPIELNRMAGRAYESWKKRFTLERFQSEVCAAIERCAADLTPLQTVRARATAW